MKYLFILGLLISAQSNAQTIGDYVTSADGKFVWMEQFEAEKYCQDHGTRLPTVWEYAEYAVHLGAKGILKTAYPNVPLYFRGINYPTPPVYNKELLNEVAEMQRNEYYQVTSTKSDTREYVLFYLNKTGFNASSEKFPEANLWTSTTLFGKLSPPSTAPQMAYFFRNWEGNFFPHERKDSLGISVAGVRCINP